MAPRRKERTMRMRLVGAGVLVGAVALAGVAAAQKETRGVSKTEIVLGMHTDLSGPAATYGVSSSNAVKMRFDELNEKGGIHGRRIKLVVEDTQYQVPRAVQAGTKLINRDHIFAMVAGLGTPMNNALFKDQLDAGVPNLFPLSAARSMFEPFHKLKFYGAATYVDQVRAGINYFATKKGKKAVCAMYQDTDFGTEGLYAMGLTDMPYRDTLGPSAQAWFDRYKERYKVDPNIGAIYGHVAADLTAVALEKAGPELTLDTFVRAMESIRGYRDIFNGPEVNFGPDKHQGANSSFLAVVKGGRWVRLTDPLAF